MPDRVIAQLTCEPCEGTKWVTQFQLPDGKSYVVPCPQEKVEERARMAAAELNRPADEDLRGSMRRKLLSFQFQAFMEHATYTGTPCEDCSGRGWTLRLVQTESPGQGDDHATP